MNFANNLTNQDNIMKYKLDKTNTIQYYGRTLFAVVALMSFRDVKEGDIGGYIESETNLSQTGNGWIYRKAKVMGKTIIHDGVFRGGVFLGGEFLGGEFHGGVFLGGEFHDGVFRGGEFRGGMFLGGEFHDGVFRGGEFRGGYLMLQIQGSKHILNIPDGQHIRIGCQEYTPDGWLSGGLAIAADNGYDDVQVAEYKLYIELAITVINQIKQ